MDDRLCLCDPSASIIIIIIYRCHIGVTCTADLRDPTNILSAGKFNLLPQRVFSVGRLDKDSSGGYRCNLLYGGGGVYMFYSKGG